MTRFLLCRPVGGLNDILCEIEKCWRYAERHGRILVVDTLGSGLVDHFDRSFERRSREAPVLLRASPAFIERLAGLSVLPSVLGDGRLLAYETRWRRFHCIEAASGTPLTFDFSVDHDADLLVHQQSSGSLLSLDCLARLRFRDEVARAIRKRLPVRPNGYDAIHVRNTDMRTNYRRLFRRLRKALAGKDVLIASDDAASIAFAKAYFTDSNVFTVSDIPDTGGVRLHRNAALDRPATNLDSFVDLLAMAGAKSLHFERHETWNRWLGLFSERPVSGFAKLAEALHKRPDLVESLLLHAPREGGG